MTISIGIDHCNAMTGSKIYFFTRLSSRHVAGRIRAVVPITQVASQASSASDSSCCRSWRMITYNANTRIAIWRAS